MISSRRPLRSPTIKIGGKLQKGHFNVEICLLQFGHSLAECLMMLFLQHSQSGSPMWPQPLQEWGIRRSKMLGNVVFFTIKLIFLLILL